VNVAFISVVPKVKVEEFNFDKIIEEELYIKLFGEKGGRIFLSFIIFSVIGTAASSIFSGSRVLAHAAQLKYIPIFSDKLKWDRKEEAPRSALIAQFMWCSLLIILLHGGVSFDTYESFILFFQYSSCFFYTLTGIGLLYLRRIKPGEFRIYNIHSLIVYLYVAGRIVTVIISFVDITCYLGSRTNNCIVGIEDQAPYVISFCIIVMSIVCYLTCYSSSNRENTKNIPNDDDDET
jgi:amino acid transporter